VILLTIGSTSNSYQIDFKVLLALNIFCDHI